LLLTILLWGHIGFAQMTYNYSSYVQYSADATHIYATAVVDGSATCNNIHIQSLNCAIYHQGKVYLTLGNTGGWVYGAQVNPNSYISVTNSQTLANPADNTDYTVNADEEVFCSGIVGLVFFQGGPTVLRIASTYFGPPVVVGGGDKCYWGSLACSAGTQPTCKAGSGYLFAPKCPNYVKTDYLVVNNGITAPVCIGIGLIFAETGPGPCD
jgi:hypothetical protein